MHAGDGSNEEKTDKSESWRGNRMQRKCEVDKD